jgi:hypothetical protein
MARGKFNKRGGGKRVDAQSAQEIEQRNDRLTEFQNQRIQRRADAAEEEAGGKPGGEEKTEEVEKKVKKSKPLEKADPVPVVLTTPEDHKRNMAKLEYVRKRREVAEKRRVAEEEADKAIEDERIAQSNARQAANERDSDDEDDKKKKKKKGGVKEIPQLSKIDIKKMKPALLKEALKERALDIQGNSKVLTARLLEYEAAR